MTLALAYLAGMASMVVIMFLRGCSECEGCEQLSQTLRTYKSAYKDLCNAHQNTLQHLIEKEAKHADHLRMVDDVMDRLSGFTGAIK